jgi:hypothetical protein
MASSLAAGNNGIGKGLQNSVRMAYYPHACHCFLLFLPAVTVSLAERRMILRDSGVASRKVSFSGGHGHATVHLRFPIQKNIAEKRRPCCVMSLGESPSTE